MWLLSTIAVISIICLLYYLSSSGIVIDKQHLPIRYVKSIILGQLPFPHITHLPEQWILVVRNHLKCEIKVKVNETIWNKIKIGDYWTNENIKTK